MKLKSFRQKDETEFAQITIDLVAIIKCFILIKKLNISWALALKSTMKRLNNAHENLPIKT